MSVLAASPMLLVSLIGIAFLIWVLRNFMSPNPFYVIRGARFYKSVAPTWFALFTVFYACLAVALIAGPIMLLWMIRST